LASLDVRDLSTPLIRGVVQSAAASKDPAMKVSRTENSWRLPHCEQWIVSLVDHDARRLSASVSIPVGTRRCVAGQV
jgi:hypothetical protein